MGNKKIVQKNRLSLCLSLCLFFTSSALFWPPALISMQRPLLSLGEQTVRLVGARVGPVLMRQFVDTVVPGQTSLTGVLLDPESWSLVRKWFKENATAVTTPPIVKQTVEQAKDTLSTLREQAAPTIATIEPGKVIVVGIVRDISKAITGKDKQADAANLLPYLIDEEGIETPDTETAEKILVAVLSSSYAILQPLSLIKKPTLFGQIEERLALEKRWPSLGGGRLAQVLALPTPQIASGVIKPIKEEPAESIVQQPFPLTPVPLSISMTKKFMADYMRTSSPIPFVKVPKSERVLSRFVPDYPYAQAVGPLLLMPERPILQQPARQQEVGKTQEQRFEDIFAEVRVPEIPQERALGEREKLLEEIKKAEPVKAEPVKAEPVKAEAMVVPEKTVTEPVLPQEQRVAEQVAREKIVPEKKGETIFSRLRKFFSGLLPETVVKEPVQAAKALKETITVPVSKPAEQLITQQPAAEALVVAQPKKVETVVTAEGILGAANLTDVTNRLLPLPTLSQEQWLRLGGALSRFAEMVTRRQTLFGGEALGLVARQMVPGQSYLPTIPDVALTRLVDLKKYNLALGWIRKGMLPRTFSFEGLWSSLSGANGLPVAVIGHTPLGEYYPFVFNRDNLLAFGPLSGAGQKVGGVPAVEDQTAESILRRPGLILPALPAQEEPREAAVAGPSTEDEDILEYEEEETPVAGPSAQPEKEEVVVERVTPGEVDDILDYEEPEGVGPREPLVPVEQQGGVVEEPAVEGPVQPLPTPPVALPALKEEKAEQESTIIPVQEVAEEGQLPFTVPVAEEILVTPPEEPQGTRPVKPLSKTTQKKPGSLQESVTAEEVFGAALPSVLEQPRVVQADLTGPRPKDVVTPTVESLVAGGVPEQPTVSPQKSKIPTADEMLQQAREHVRVEEPVVSESKQPKTTEETPVAEPSGVQPAAEESTVEQVTPEQVTPEQTREESVVPATGVEQPAVEQPAVGQPAVGQLGVESPVKEGAKGSFTEWLAQLYARAAEIKKTGPKVPKSKESPIQKMTKRELKRIAARDKIRELVQQSLPVEEALVKEWMDAGGPTWPLGLGHKKGREEAAQKLFVAYNTLLKFSENGGIDRVKESIFSVLEDKKIAEYTTSLQAMRNRLGVALSKFIDGLQGYVPDVVAQKIQYWRTLAGI